MRTALFGLAMVLAPGCAASDLDGSIIQEAVAIPAFMKNARKAKTYETTPSSAPDAVGAVSWSVLDTSSTTPAGGTLVWGVKQFDALGIGELRGADGRLRCQFSDGVLMDAGGRPLLVVRDAEIYDAAGRIRRYDFVGTEVRDARGVAMTTDPELESADPLQQAAVGALLDGLCR